MNLLKDQFLEQISHPFSIFFFIAYVLSLLMFHMKIRRRIMATKFISDSNFAIYYYFMGGLPGALGAIIAAMGGFIQAATPERYLVKTKYYRMAFAIFLALLSIHFATAKSTDLLPLLAIIVGRLAEISSSPQRIRVGMALTFPAWMYYNFSHDYYLLLFANVSALMSLGYAIMKHHRVRYITGPV